MIKKFINAHRIFLLIVLFLVVFSYIWSAFINPHTIILGGEYIFSFDDIGHIQNILYDPRSILAQDNTNCFDCPDFYAYSRWYSLFKIGYHSLSQILFLHPFVFLILSMVLTQLMSLYIFIKTFFKKFSWIPFLIATFVFIFYPYKFSLIIETHDGLYYSNMILFITIFVWSLKQINKLNIKKLVTVSFITGLLFSFFLNADVAFLPIAFYMGLIIAAIFWRQVFCNLKKILVYLVVMAIPIIAINIPLLLSLSQNGDTRHYEGYISFNAIDSFLGGLSIAKTDTSIIISFIILFLFCFIYAPIKRSLKIWMAVAYLFVGILMWGVNSPVNLYQWIFSTIPLMDSLRSTYRFIFFEMLFYFIVIYFSLQRLLKKTKIHLTLFIILCLVCIYLPTQYIYTNRNYFFVSILPQQYFDTQNYLKNNYDKKVYFPPETPLFHSITTDYPWGNLTYNQTIILYKNPFTNLLPLHNLIQFERFPYLLSPQYLELFYLTNLSNKPENIIKALELRGVHYIIFDKNYNWKQNYPLFNIDQFIKLTKVDKQFGNIYVLKLPDKSKLCKKGYGTISLDYCYSTTKDTKFLDKTKKEFLLEITPWEVGNKFYIRHDTDYTHSILDPIVQQSFIDNRLLINTEVMQIFGNQNNVFTTDPLSAGKYNVYISMYKGKKENKLFGDAELVVKVDDKEIKTISPYTSKPRIYWITIPVTIRNDQQITIGVKNKGYIISTAIPILQKR